MLITDGIHLADPGQIAIHQNLDGKFCLQCGRPRFDPWVWKIPWRREQLSTPVFLPGECHGQRSLAGDSSWSCKELDTTERLTLSLSGEHICKLHIQQRGLVSRLYKELSKLSGMDFPDGSDYKASACNAGDPGSIPGSGRSPGEGNGNPLQYSCLENPMDGGAWWATVHGVAKSWT